MEQTHLYPDRTEELMAMAERNRHVLHAVFGRYMRKDFMVRLANMIGDRETLPFRFLIGNKAHRLGTK